MFGNFIFCFNRVLQYSSNISLSFVNKNSRFQLIVSIQQYCILLQIICIGNVLGNENNKTFLQVKNLKNIIVKKFVI